MNTNGPLVSLIIPAKNEGDHIKNTIQSAFQVYTEYPFEIIVVDDASIDGSCDFINTQVEKRPLRLIRTKGIGAANARNLGAKLAIGQYFIFCDAHVFFEDFWIERLLEPIQQGFADGITPGIANTSTPEHPGYGQTVNQYLGVQWQMNVTSISPTAILPGGCFAISRDVFFDIGGFDQAYQVWGFEDIDFSVKLWLFGYSCYVQPAVKILHVFRNSHPYTVEWNHYYFNMMRMAYSHFKQERIDKCKSLIVYCDPSYIESLVLKSEVLKQRQQFFARRKFDDDWFMNKFGIPF